MQAILQFIVMMFYYLNIYRNLNLNNHKMKMFMYLFPIAMHVSFDISMEGVQFPMIFLTFLGYYYTKLKLVEDKL